MSCKVKSQYSGSNYYKCKGWRLPTEAEWEYATRAGTTGARYGNVDDIAWHSGNSGKKAHPVQQKKANAWGLYDMLGNVWEWVYDWYGAYPIGSSVDPVGPGTGSKRGVRGGSWEEYIRLCRAAVRGSDSPSYRHYARGFRPARSY